MTFGDVRVHQLHRETRDRLSRGRFSKFHSCRARAGGGSSRRLGPTPPCIRGGIPCFGCLLRLYDRPASRHEEKAGLTRPSGQLGHYRGFATGDNGVGIRVPLFIAQDEMVRVEVETARYLERVRGERKRGA